MAGGMHFGSLTFINGSAVNLRNYDKNGDGTLQEDEIAKLLADYQLDTYNFQSLDTNGDKEITAEEFMIWGERIKADYTLNQFVDEILSVEFIGELAPYQKNVIDDLKAVLNELIETAKPEEIGQIAEKFTALLPKKYVELKSMYMMEAENKSHENDELLAVTTEAVNDVFKELMNNVMPDGAVFGEALTDRQKQLIIRTLRQEAQSYMTSYDGGIATYKLSLTTYLKGFMESSEISLMEEDNASWADFVRGLGGYISQNEFNKLKNRAKVYLESVLNNGISVYYNDKKLTADNIDEILNNYTRGSARGLIDFVNEITKNLSGATKLDTLVSGNTNEIRINAEVPNTDDEGSNSRGENLDKKILDMVDKVIEELYTEYVDQYSAQNSSYKDNLGVALEREAILYMETHQTASEEAVIAYLKKYMEQTVSGALSSYIDNWVEVSQ